MHISLMQSFRAKTERFAKLLTSVEFTNGRGESMHIEDGVDAVLAMMRAARDQGRRVFVLGNGGSAAIASHTVNDLVNNGRLQASVIHDASLLTCMANDYGYENAYARILDVQASAGDLLFAISSSGQSLNIRKAVEAMGDRGGRTVTLTGFNKDNPLRAMGDLNIWLDSSDYGSVEVGHQFVLHHLCDRFHENGAR